MPEGKVTILRPLDGGGHEIEMENLLNKGRKYPNLKSKIVVLAAVVLGTLEILFRCRDEVRTLPNISPCLGNIVRTNSEAVVGVLSDDPDIDLTEGTTISSHFYSNEHTHITHNRFPQGYSFMKWYMGPSVDNPHPAKRALKRLAEFIRHLLQATASWRTKHWHRKINVLTVMQDIDNQVSFHYGYDVLSLWRKRLVSNQVPGKRAPTYLPEANRAARVFAQQAEATPLNVLFESLFGMSTTAHILGGCQIGKDRESGVIDSNHQTFGYPDFYVVDGSAIPANVSVNPSLTIPALAERCIARITERIRESFKYLREESSAIDSGKLKIVSIEIEKID